MCVSLDWLCLYGVVADVDYHSARGVGLAAQLGARWVSACGCNNCCVGTAVRVMPSEGLRHVYGWSNPGQHPDVQHLFSTVPPAGAPWCAARSCQPLVFCCVFHN